jgi:enoyl-CoA hydratase/carnithine racemase
METTDSPLSSEIELNVADGVATITLNRPYRRNAFTLPMIHAWADALEDAARDSAVGAIVLTGAGAAFCSGIDLDVLAGLENTPLARRVMLTDHIHRIPLICDRLDKPLIAAVGGPAVGAGMDMALMCDLRLVSESAYFSAAYVRIGVVPGDGGAYYLPRLVGVAKALELLLTGDRVDAQQALQIGLANRVVPDAELADAAHSLAARLAAGPPIATRMIKRLVYQSASIDLPTALNLVASQMGIAMLTDDHLEAVAALEEKRRPAFQGR